MSLNIVIPWPHLQRLAHQALEAAQMPSWSDLNFHPKIVSKLPPLPETQIYLTFHQYKTEFPTSALLASRDVKTWKLQEKCISIDPTKQEWD